MSVLVVAMTLSWAIIVLGCWIGYQLLRQNGRILLRLEALEGRLTGLLGPETPPGLLLGQAAPEFELPNLEGGRTALSQFRGQRVLLVFFDPQCSFCREMAPQLAAVPPDRASGLVPLVVTTGNGEEINALVRRYGIRCPVLLEGHTTVASTYQAHGTPTGYLIDGEGRIASPLAVGAGALMALASGHDDGATLRAGAGGSGHRVYKGNRPLSASRIARSGLRAGTRAPGFRLPRLDGGELSLEEYRGRPVLLVFSDPECGACDQLAPQLERLHRRTASVQVVMVSRRDAPANRKKVQEFGLTFPVVLQRQWEVSRMYGIFVSPVGYLIDEQGVIVADVAVGVDPILTLLSDGGGWALRKEVREVVGSHQEAV